MLRIEARGQAGMWNTRPATLTTTLTRLPGDRAVHPRCLFLMEDHPLSPNAPGGGPATMRHHLELALGSAGETALLMVRLGSDSFGWDAFRHHRAEEWNAVRCRCVWTDVLTLDRADSIGERAARLLRSWADPLAYLTRHVRARSLAALGRMIDAFEPDIIWAENFMPAALALRVARGRTVIYSHHDWVWRVWAHASHSKSQRWRSSIVCRLMRRGEEALVRRAAAVVSTSATETVELRAFNPRSAYVPPAYPPVNLAACQTATNVPRLVHVGGMTTPSNRLGLERFLDTAWPLISASGSPALWVVGSLTRAPESLLRKLAEAGAHCTGFVEDLATVLRPHDIQIVPWEHNTGTRMKIPLAFNFAQAVVATRATAACLPELVDGENCLLVDDLTSMARTIRHLLADRSLCERLGTNARLTFERCYTLAAARPQFERLLESLASHPGQGIESA